MTSSESGSPRAAADRFAVPRAAGPLRWFRRSILARPWAAFLTLAASSIVFGAGSLNLFHLFRANFELLANYGWQAAMDGGLQQLAELLATGFACLVAYLVFKACEHAFVDWLSGHGHEAEHRADDGSGSNGTSAANDEGEAPPVQQDSAAGN